MLVVMQPNASSADIDRVCEEITRQGFKPLPLPGEVRTAIGLLGDDAKVDWSYIEGLPGVSSVLIVQKPFRQASREWKPETTIVEIAPGVRFGGPDVPVVAGPCSVESEQQIL
ncbi:MAG: 3-deoxy-7-phosphoheptulonate synthase, partial [Gemmatimonas sp.]